MRTQDAIETPWKSKTKRVERVRQMRLKERADLIFVFTKSFFLGRFIGIKFYENLYSSMDLGLYLATKSY
jgi:hypothetical protein